MGEYQFHIQQAIAQAESQIAASYPNAQPISVIMSAQRSSHIVEIIAASAGARKLRDYLLGKINRLIDDNNREMLLKISECESTTATIVIYGRLVEKIHNAWYYNDMDVLRKLHDML